MRDTYGLRSAVRPVAFALTCFGFTSAALAQPTPAVDPAAAPTAAPQPDVEAPKAATEAAPLPPAAPAVVEVPPPPPAAAPEAPKVDPNSGVVSFKPGKGLDIKSSDGNFALKIQVKAQLLDEFAKLQGQKKASNDFIVRRLRVAFGGNVFSPNIKYKTELTFAAAELNRIEPRTAEAVIPADPNVMGSKASVATLDRDVITQSPLLDAYFDFTHLRDLSVRVGQSKIPFGRERMLSDNEMIVVDRSLEDAAYNFDRDMGIDIRSNDFLGLNLLHYYLGVWAAEDRNTSFGTLGRGDLGLLYNGRVEFVPFGNFEEVAGDFDRGAPKLSIGAAYAFLQTDGTSPYANQTLGGLIPNTKLQQQAKIDYNVHNVTADLLFKAGGFSFLGAFHYRKVSDLPKEVTKARSGLGFTVQGGYIVSADFPLEIYGMFGAVRQVKKATSNTVASNEAGGGLTYYFNRQGLKLQAELARIWFPDAAVAVNPKAKDGNDTRFRLQLQVLL